MFQGWITPQFQIADETFRAWSTLALPVFLATLAVVVGRLTLDRPMPSPASVVRADRQRLGDRRYSSARLWFSAFASQLTAAEGIETHLEGDECLDLELVSIQETILASSPTLVDDDRDALDWLVGHFRRQLLNEETSTQDRPALSACWLVFGTARTRRFGFRSRSVARLRLVNASDLGRQAFVSLGWTSGSGRFGSSVRPIVGVVRESDPGLLVDHLRGMPRRIESAGDVLLAESSAARLLAATRSHTTDLPLSDPIVSAIDAARATVTSAWGDHWWTEGSAFDTGERSAVEARCALFTDTDPIELRCTPVSGRDTTEART